MKELQELTRGIEPVDANFLEKAEHHLMQLTKPPHSLGRLEELAARFVAITQNLHPKIEKKTIFVLSADHGVAAERVSAYPKEVTQQMVANFVSGGAAINVLARQVGAEVKIVDVGVDADLAEVPYLIRRKIRPGTRNFCAGPAMTIAETLAAMKVGCELAVEAAREGSDLVGMGEMGIGNTTASSALLAVFLQKAPEEVTGFGTGIEEQARARKVETIRRAISVNRANLGTPLPTLAALGGLEIAALCGLVLGAGRCRLPVVVDGFISSVAALIAIEMQPHVADYLYFAHLSPELGHRLLLENLKRRPILDLEMRLGEGTGAALAMGIIEAAVRTYSEMATFETAGVSGRSSP